MPAGDRDSFEAVIEAGYGEALGNNLQVLATVLNAHSKTLSHLPLVKRRYRTKRPRRVKNEK